MRILDSVFDFIVEEVKNKNLFFRLMSDWRKTFPNLTDEQGEFIFNRHEEVRKQINPTNHQNPTNHSLDREILGKSRD